jgi:hypothetical protein
VFASSVWGVPGNSGGGGCDNTTSGVGEMAQGTVVGKDRGWVWASGSLDRNGHVLFPIWGVKPSPSRVGFWQSHSFNGLGVKTRL